MDKRIKELDPEINSNITDLTQFVVPIDNDDYFESKKLSLQQVKELIVGNQTGSNAIKVFYVDGNNTSDGDGSIFNPFKTLDLAYNKVVGNGNPNAPQYSGVNIEVNAAVYNTSLNIFIAGITWTFKDNAVINYTGNGYLVDLTDYNNVSSVFRIAGKGDFFITNGGFVKNFGVGLSQVVQKAVLLEVNNVDSVTPLGTGSNPTMTMPLIWLTKTATGGGYNPPNIRMTVHGHVASLFQNTVVVEGACFLSIEGNGTVSYGSQRNGSIGDNRGSVIHYRNLDNSSRAYLGSMKIEDISIAADSCDRVIYLEGAFGGTGYIRGVDIIGTRAQSVVGRIIEFGDVRLVPYNTLLGNFIIENLMISRELEISNPDIVRWVGNTTNMNKLDFLRCYFPNGKYINSNVAVNANLGCVENVFNGNFHLSNVPVYDSQSAASAVLRQGSVFRNSSGTLQIVM